ncbi:hypothetical protein [Bacillus cereus group sp. BfR-BA-01394]
MDGKEQLTGAMRYVKGSQQYLLGETAVEVAASILTNNEPTEVAWNDESNGDYLLSLVRLLKWD